MRPNEALGHRRTPGEQPDGRGLKGIGGKPALPGEQLLYTNLTARCFLQSAWSNEEQDGSPKERPRTENLSRLPLLGSAIKHASTERQAVTSDELNEGFWPPNGCREGSLQCSIPVVGSDTDTDMLNVTSGRSSCKMRPLKSVHVQKWAGTTFD